MADAHFYATGVDRTRHGVASEVLDALAAARPAWWDDALCRGRTQEFFPNPNDNAALAAAIEVCRGCPVRQPCRDAARANGEKYGVWGAVAMVQRPQRRDPVPLREYVCTWCGARFSRQLRTGERPCCGAEECRRARSRDSVARSRAKAG